MKAILVIDMPKNCLQCQILCDFRAGNGYRPCMSDKCPLKPMPEKNTWDITKNGHVTEYAEGWNACLEEITE